MLQFSGGLYELAWTEDILAEAIATLRRNKPNVSGGLITDMRDKIAESLQSGRIDDFVIDGSFTGRDEKDRHVHAAAIAGRVDYLITSDRGFSSPDVDLDALPYEVHSPDDFFILVDDSAPGRVRTVTAKQQEYWSARQPCKTLPGALRDADCFKFAERISGHLAQLTFQAQLDS